MRRMLALLSVPLLALPLVACEPRSAPAPSPAAEAVLGHLEMRGARVTILGGPDGPRYTVATEEEGIVAERLSESELAARFPDLHERLESGVASGNHAIALPED